jgi:DNA polymerase-3 subunit delta'
MAGGNHPDVTEIEAEGKYIKIDQLRDYSKQLHYHSFEGGYKVGIIPECEMMRVEAQNTNLSKIVPTIQSRCQLIRLGPLPLSVIKELVAQERDLEPEKAELVASLAQGNAVRALDMDLGMVVDTRKEIILKLLEIGPDDRTAILDFAEKLSKNESSQAFLLDLLTGFYLDVLYLKLGKTDIRNKDLIEQAGREARKTPLKTIISRVESARRARDMIYLSNANARLTWEVLTMSLKGVPGAEVISP